MGEDTRARVSLLAAVFVGCLLLSFPASAFAASPGLVPVTLIAETFESTPNNYTVEYPGTATWAPITQRYRTGAKGLWCAGSAGWTTTYKSGASGIAKFLLSSTRHYYSTKLEFYYLKPSMGTEDVFQVQWEPTPAGVSHGDSSVWPNTTTWKYGAVDLSGPDATQGSLSRRPGSFFFQFHDTPIPSGVGEGPTIDDVKVTAWKYGRVRDLTSTVTPGSVELSWARPYRSTFETATEERSIGYRVWRAPYGTSSWTELTTASITATGFPSPRPASGSRYSYLVQAWDAGGSYGIPVIEDVSLPGNPVLTPALRQTITPTTTGYGAPATVTGALTLSGGPLAGAKVQLQHYSGSWKWLQTKTTDATGKVVFSVAPVDKTSYRLVFSESGFATVAGAGVAVTPKPYVGTPSKPSKVYKSKSFTARGTLKPRHTAGKSTYVKIKCYRWEKNKWVYRKGFWATTYDYSSYSRYRASVKLPYAGTWKMRAYAPADSKHASAYSSYTSKFKVY